MPVQVRLPALFFRLNPHFQLSAGVDSFSLLNISIIALAEEIFLLKSIRVYFGLLEHTINLDEIVPVSFLCYFHAATSRYRKHLLYPMLKALLLQLIFSILTSSLLIVFLKPHQVNLHRYPLRKKNNYFVKHIYIS